LFVLPPPQMLRKVCLKKRDRVLTAIQGGIPDRLPATLWFHFGGAFLSPKDQVDYYVRTIVPRDWDLLKVMFDYRPRVALDIDFSSPAAIARTLRGIDWDEPFRRQRALLTSLTTSVGDDLPLIDTIYSPWFSLVRWVGYDREKALLVDHSAVASVLDEIAAVICHHTRWLSSMGIHGYFYASIAASKALTSESLELQLQLDRQVLSSSRGLHRYLHLHGLDIELARVSTLEFDVLNYHDRHPSNPQLGHARTTISQCLMGGVCERTLTHTSPANTERQIRQAVAEIEGRGLILAPGCAVSASVSESHCDAIQRASRVFS
jgi:uroporphyrinogen decarboxylase